MQLEHSGIAIIDCHMTQRLFHHKPNEVHESERRLVGRQTKNYFVLTTLHLLTMSMKEKDGSLLHQQVFQQK